MITAVSLGATIGEATSDITILDDDSQLHIWCISLCKYYPENQYNCYNNVRYYN